MLFVRSAHVRNARPSTEGAVAALQRLAGLDLRRERQREGLDAVEGSQEPVHPGHDAHVALRVRHLAGRNAGKP